jgi:hypothetical protein
MRGWGSAILSDIEVGVAQATLAMHELWSLLVRRGREEPANAA